MRLRAPRSTTSLTSLLLTAAVAAVLALSAGCADSSDGGTDASVGADAGPPDVRDWDSNSGLPGDRCDGNQSCASGFCSDGVCCATACNGVCETCNQPQAMGTCTPLNAGLDPDNECAPEAATSCGRTGVCDGAGACQKQPSGTVCGTRSCAGTNMSARPDTCDGNGTCADAGNDTCARAFTCDSSTGQCRTSCSAPTDCVAGFTCVSGQCKLAQTGTCTLDSECASGFCTDGKCCSERCDGACVRCNVAGQEGLCLPEAAGTDPNNECPTETATSCGRTGMCSGVSGCALFPATTSCAPATCLGTMASQNPRSCNGTGMCADAGMANCGVYTCNAGTGACRTACVTGADCATGYQCATGGVCKKSPGQPCSAGAAGDAECALGFCTDGVCCNARCGGTCESCAQTGRLGFCDPVPNNTDPGDECATDAPSSCDRNGFCNGARACALYPASTVCSPSSCPTTTSYAGQDVCDGVGNCPDTGTASCGIYVCSPTAGPCRTDCGANGDCASGYVCDIATRRCKRPVGGGCSIGSECISGACCGSICRDITSDANFCGSCSNVCMAVGGSNPCTSSACAPSCTSGFQNCDSNNSNGCELQRASGQVCQGAGFLGSASGDLGADTLTTSGTSSAFYRVTIPESNSSSLYLSAWVVLAVDAGIDFDLYVTCAACGDARVASSTKLAGVTDQVNLYRADSAATDTFDILIEVRYYNATMCGGWNLTVNGNRVVSTTPAATDPPTLQCN